MRRRIAGLLPVRGGRLPLILDCVKTYCTVGEISDAMRDVFGTYEEPAVF